MSAVDAPPGLPLSDLAAGEFQATPSSRRLARRAFTYVMAVAIFTFIAASGRSRAALVELLFVAPAVCMAVAMVGYAVRRARLRIDADGVRWGWTRLGFRMRQPRIKRVRVYTDALALTPKLGSTWYVSHRDWHDFERIPAALERAAIPFERHTRRAPLGARLQGYGLVLDVLLVANALAVTFALVVALAI